MSWPSGYVPNLKSLRALSRPLRECSWEGRRYFRLQEDPSCSMYALYHLGVLGHIGFKVHPSIFSDFAQLLPRIYEVLKRPSRLSKSPGCTDWSIKSVVFAKICTVATAASTVADMTSAINFVLSKPPANGTRRVSHQPGTLHRETKQWTQRPFSASWHRADYSPRGRKCTSSVSAVLARVPVDIVSDRRQLLLCRCWL